MLRIAVCDDEEDQREAMHQMVQQYVSPPKSASSIEAHIADFSCAHDLLASLGEGSVFDIALLDIYMPEMDGVTLAREIQSRSPDTRIIFLTSSVDYAVTAYALGAVHYLVKPFAQKDVFAALDRACASLPCVPKKIVINGEHRATSVVNIDDIICVESVGYVRNVTTKNGILIEKRLTLSDFLSEFNRLSPGQFMLPYRGYVINLAAVRTVAPLCVEMKDGTKIPLKRGDYTAVKNALFDYSFVRGGGILNDHILAHRAFCKQRDLWVPCGLSVLAF